MERPNNTNLLLMVGTAVFLGLIAYFTFAGGKDPDVLGDNANLTQVQSSNSNNLCSGQQVYDQIKTALFREAAGLRGAEGSELVAIGEKASVRMENPVAEGSDGSNSVTNCSGSMAIDLPPGVATTAGRNRVMADVDYGVTSSDSGSRVVAVRNVDGLVSTLSGLTAQSQTNLPGSGQDVFTNDMADDGGSMDDPLPPDMPPATLPPAQPRPAPSARPSYDCSKARSQSERMVCADPGLAALDRAMAAEYVRSMAQVSPTQQAQLRQSRDRFLVYRDNCPNAACIAGAYQDRIREIRDIASGRWAPPR